MRQWCSCWRPISEFLPRLSRSPSGTPTTSRRCRRWSTPTSGALSPNSSPSATSRFESRPAPTRSSARGRSTASARASTSMLMQSTRPIGPFTRHDSRNIQIIAHYHSTRLGNYEEREGAGGMHGNCCIEVLGASMNSFCDEKQEYINQQQLLASTVVLFSAVLAESSSVRYCTAPWRSAL